jgi:predicted anti-sigma-YlaC factor YlaD
MKCRDLKKLISAYTDSELPRTQREFVEEHLAGCADCRVLLESYQEVNRKLATLGVMPFRSDIKGTTMSRIKADTFTGKPALKWLRPALAITAILAAVTVFWVMPFEISSTHGNAMSPPPLTWDKVNVMLSLFLLVAFLIISGRLAVNNRYARIASGIASILCGVLGIGISLHASQIGYTERLFTMGIISVFGLIWGIVYLTRHTINHWVAVTEVVLCSAVLILEATVFIGPVTQVWLTIITIVIPVGIIIYAFNRELKQTPQKWLPRALMIIVLMVGVSVLLADQLRGTGISGKDGGLMSPSTSHPPLSYIIVTDIGWLALILGTLIMLGLRFRNRFAGAVADVGSISFGIFGWYAGLYALSTPGNDLFLGMGIIPILGLMMGIAQITGNADRRWIAFTGIVLCISALVLDIVFLITYPGGIYFWFTFATMVIPIVIIVYAFRTKIQSPSRRWLRPVLVAVPIVTILIVITILQPWGSFPAPKTIMAKAYAATSSVQSFRFNLSVFPGPDQEMRLEAEYSSPDRYHVRMIEGQKVEEFIVIGNQQYVKNTSMSKNMIKATIAGFSSLLDKDSTIGRMNLLTDIKQLRDEKIDDTECLHYKGRIDMEKQIAEAKRSMQESRDRIGADQPTDEEIDADLAQMRSVNIEVELWIDKADNLIRQLKQTKQGGFEPSSVIYKYYDFDKTIIIEPPLDAQGNLLSDWQMAGSITPNSTQPVFTRQISSGIGAQPGYDDYAHQQISYRVTITNQSSDTVKNVRVILTTLATNEEIKPAVLEGIPENPVHLDLASDESEAYNFVWNFNPGNQSKEEILKLVEQTKITVKFTARDGSELTQRLYPNEPYPTNTPPVSPPVK